MNPFGVSGVRALCPLVLAGQAIVAHARGAHKLKGAPALAPLLRAGTFPVCYLSSVAVVGKM